MGLIEQDAAQARVSLEDRRKKRPHAASHIREDAQAREVVALHHRLGHSRREARHSRVEDRTFLWAVRSVLPYASLVQLGEGRLAALDAVEQVGPSRPVVRLTDLHGPSAHRAGGVSPEVLRKRRHPEATVGLLSEHAYASQGAQKPVEGGSMRTRGLGQLIRALGPIL